MVTILQDLATFFTQEGCGGAKICWGTICVILVVAVVLPG